MKAYCDDCSDIVDVIHSKKSPSGKPLCTECRGREVSVPIWLHEELADKIQLVVTELREVTSLASGASAKRAYSLATKANEGCG